jgi:hypothetical protein
MLMILAWWTDTPVGIAFLAFGVRKWYIYICTYGRRFNPKLLTGVPQAGVSVDSPLVARKGGCI